jgi:hypothetical protein
MLLGAVALTGIRSRGLAGSEAGVYAFAALVGISLDADPADAPGACSRH